jgi:alkanesulfonate monooxygenase SsuD/methylene tetrahydromethanopterin reductase-like flavin-dependent oxidoreductase (luciferase family)
VSTCLVCGHDHPPVDHEAELCRPAGFAESALRRVGKRADGWLPAWQVPEGFPIAMLTGAHDTIRKAADQAGGDPDAIRTVLRIDPMPGSTERAIVEQTLR